MSYRSTLKTLLMASICLTATAALADHGSSGNDGDRGSSDSHISATGAAARDAHGNGDDSASDSNPAMTFIAGVGPVSASTSEDLRFTNIGDSAGTATVTLYAADTGVQLATWTSPSIPSFGTLQVDVSALIAAATPALTTTQASAPLNLGVNAGFKGTVQTLLVNGGVLSNLSRCERDAGRKIIGSVAGPGGLTTTSAIEIANRGDAAQTATLTLHSSVDGTVLGSWTSPSIPSHGSLRISGTALAAAASPVVPAMTASFTVEASTVPAGVILSHLSQPAGGGLMTDLSLACRIVETGHDGDADADDN